MRTNELKYSDVVGSLSMNVFEPLSLTHSLSNNTQSLFTSNVVFPHQPLVFLITPPGHLIYKWQLNIQKTQISMATGITPSDTVCPSSSVPFYILGDPEVTANIYYKSRNLPNTDTQNYSTDLR